MIRDASNFSTDVALCGVVVNILDSGIIISKFEIHSSYYVHLRTNSVEY